MKLNARPLRITDLWRLPRHPHYPAIKSALWKTFGVALGGAILKNGWTIEENSRPVGCFGILENSYTWMMVDPAVSRGATLRAARLLRRILEQHGGPLYAHIDTEYEPAVRCARLGGFRPTGAQELGLNVWEYP